MHSKIANAVANIKSGLKTKKLFVHSYHNKFLKRILNKLVSEGVIRGFSKDVSNFNRIKIYLKYDSDFVPVVENLTIMSTSGKRVYYKFKQLLEAQQRGEIYIISTNQGLFSTTELIYNGLKIGGEVLLKITYY